jgi:radical SAM protein (TIGR04043 family)
MPGKAEITVEQYFTAFETAVRIFGRGQVSTYILAGLGDTEQAILTSCEKLISIGVYPFVVPFVPLNGTPLAGHCAPTAQFMRALLVPLGRMLASANLRSGDIKAGCGRCGACSTLAAYEN